MTDARALDGANPGMCDQRKGFHPDPMQNICNRPAVLRYATQGGGYMMLCAVHGEKHRSYCEVWNGLEWHRP